MIQVLKRSARLFLLLFVGAYRTIGTTHLGGSCRFEPSCSEYALEAIRLHSPTTAVRLITSRVCRCRPGGSFGYDPVPSPQEWRELKSPQEWRNLKPLKRHVVLKEL